MLIHTKTSQIYTKENVHINAHIFIHTQTCSDTHEHTKTYTDMLTQTY